MDTIALVENQIDDGQRLLDRLYEEGFAVRAACWAKPAEEDSWSFYISSPVVDETGVTAAYRQVFRVLRSLGGVWVTDSDIKLVGDKHAVTHDLLDMLRRYPGRMPTRSRRPLLGGVPVDEVYVYPLVKAKPVEVKIYGLVYRGEPTGALHLSFEPHNRDSKLIVGHGQNRHEYPAEVGLDWIVSAPEGATLERDEIGVKVLAWELRGNRMKSAANEIWSLANLGLHGFRFLSKPSGD